MAVTGGSSTEEVVRQLIAGVKKAFSDPVTRDKYLGALEYDTGVAGLNYADEKAATVSQIRKARQQMRTDGSASNQSPVSQEAIDRFNSYTPEQRRQVLNSGQTPSDTLAMRLPSDKKLAQAVENERIRGDLLTRARQNRQTITDQFGREIPLGEDPYQHLYAKFNSSPEEIAAYFNPHATGALAKEVARLEEHYPGTMSRLSSLKAGRSEYEAWYNGLQRAGRPGEIPYQIGLPANPGALRSGIASADVTPEMRQAYAAQGNPEWWSTGWSPDAYENVMQGTAAHELGHAVHASMLDWMHAPENFTGRGAEAIDRLSNQLGNASARYISGYAEQGRRLAQDDLLGRSLSNKATLAGREPFAELFSVARSEPGMDLYAGRSTPATIRALAGNRPPVAQEMLMDKINQLNSAEKAMRNEGFGEVGAAHAGTLGMIAAPLALGLAAAKAPTPLKSTLAGAAAGAGLGGFLGPEGALAGGTIGAAAGLGKQLFHLT